MTHRPGNEIPHDKDNPQNALPDFLSLLDNQDKLDAVQTSMSNLSFTNEPEQIPEGSATAQKRPILGRESSPNCANPPESKSPEQLCLTSPSREGSTIATPTQPQCHLDLQGPSPRSKGIDPMNKAKLKIGTMITSDILSKMKILLRSSGSASDSGYLSLPVSELEDIRTGCQLITSLDQRIPNKYEMIQTLKDLCENCPELQYLVNGINKIVQDIRKESYCKYDDLDDDANSLVVYHLKGPSEMQHWHKITYNKRVSFLDDDQSVLFSTMSSKESNLWKTIKIPRKLWQLVMHKKSEIESMYVRDVNSPAEPYEPRPILGNSYVSVACFKPNSLKTVHMIHLRKYFKGKNGLLFPSPTGFGLTLEKWRIFIRYLEDSELRLSRDASLSTLT